MAKLLSGKNILVTRPAHQAEGLAAIISDAGGIPILFPVLEILEPKDPQPLSKILTRLDEFDLAIFISPNAVNRMMNLASGMLPLPLTLKVAATGQGTAKELKKFGVRDVIVPADRFDSEALLEAIDLETVQGKHIVIFRGDGGREWLGDELSRRGGTIEYVECYRRVKPSVDVEPFLKVWADGELSAITVTSSEGLRNLFDMVGKAGRAWLRETPLFVCHARIEQAAKTLGFVRVILTPAGDEGLLQGLLHYFHPT